VQHGLGLDRVPAFDVSAACSGFVYALDLAARAVSTGDRAVLVGAGECRFRTLDRAAPGVRALFGDGAGAAVVTADHQVPSQGARLRIVATSLGADGRHHAAVRVPAGGSRMPTSAETVSSGQHALAMEDGPTVFYQAVEGFVDVAHGTLRPLGLSPNDIDLIVPHQPNLRMLERVARVLRVPLERFAIDVVTTGNIGGASVAVALDRARAAGRLAPGARILLLTAGAGIVGGAALLEVSA
jgi:3-oxoacyl-[acyl-carrier-protein] synthase-3